MNISKPILKQSFIDDLRHLGWIMLGVLGISLFIGVVATPGGANVGGLEYIVGFILLVGWADAFEGDLHFYTQLGVSRRTIFASTVVGMAISAVLFTTAFLIVVGLLSLIASAVPGDVFFATLRLQHLGGMGLAPGLLLHFVWTWAILISGAALGQFAGSLYYILSKLGRYIALGVIIFTVVLLPQLIIPRLNDFDVIIEAFVDMAVYGVSWGNPGTFISISLGIALASLIGSWFCVRRCKMKK